MTTFSQSTPGGSMPAMTVRRPGRPRSDQADEAILDAVFGLFAAGTTYDGLSMEMIASAAGVGKATIYRRWPNKEELVIDAVSRRLHLHLPVTPPPGPVRERLIYLVEMMRHDLQDDSTGSAYTVLTQVGKTNPRVYRRYFGAIIEPRRDEYRKVLREGVDRGELRADLDVERAMLMLTASMLSVCRLLPAAEPVTREFSVGLVDDFLQGARPYPEMARSTAFPPV